MAYLTQDYGLKCDTVRKLVKSTWENHQMALAIAREAGLIPDEKVEKDIKLSVYSYDKLIDLMKDYFKVDFTKNSRQRHIVDARHIVYYMLKKYTGLTLLQIGQLIGSKDHTTVIHGIEKVRNLLLACDNDITLHVTDLSELIETSFKTVEKAA
jgi:chromosomal replication initiation ATPase DnaA